MAELVVGLVLAVSSTAVAQDASGIVAPETTPDDGKEYPTAYVARPLTLPAGMVQASLWTRYRWIDDEANVSTTGVRADVGLTDRWQASAWTRWYLAPDRAWGQIVGVATRAQLLDAVRVDIAPGLSAPLLFDSDRGTEPVPAVTIDGNARIRVFRNSAVYLGNDLATFRFGDAASASIDLHAAYVIQMSDHLAVQIWMQLFHIRVAGDIPESGGPYVPGVTVFLSPVSCLDLWVGGYSGSDNEGLSAGVAARL